MNRKTIQQHIDRVDMCCFSVCILKKPLACFAGQSLLSRVGYIDHGLSAHTGHPTEKPLGCGYGMLPSINAQDKGRKWCLPPTPSKVG